MSRKNKRVVTNQDFMKKAREAMERQKNGDLVLIEPVKKLDEILSDGQRQQLERFLYEFKGSL